MNHPHSLSTIHARSNENALLLFEMSARYEWQWDDFSPALEAKSVEHRVGDTRDKVQPSILRVQPPQRARRIPRPNCRPSAAHFDLIPRQFNSGAKLDSARRRRVVFRSHLFVWTQLSYFSLPTPNCSSIFIAFIDVFSQIKKKCHAIIKCEPYF